MRILIIRSLPTSETWVDKDVIMLHACFQLLKDFVEKENGDKHVNYAAHKEFIDEVRFLYKWWEVRSKKIITDNDDENKEDSEMLERLMKIRLALWT